MYLRPHFTEVQSNSLRQSHPSKGHLPLSATFHQALNQNIEQIKGDQQTFRRRNSTIFNFAWFLNGDLYYKENCKISVSPYRDRDGAK